MRICLRNFFGIILLIAVIALTCTGCADGAYSAEIISGSFEKDAENNAAEIAETITIGNSAYEVRYSKSVRSELTDKLYDIYEVADSPDKSMPGKIKIDSKTKEAVRFSQINPYPNIANIDALSDDELKSVVEQLLGNTVDFSQYNVFEATRPTASNSKYRLWWQAKRGLLCNIALEIVVSKEGAIELFSKTDACPSDLTGSFVSESERNKLLENEISRYLGVKSPEAFEYEIISETLTYFHNKNSIIYAVRVISNGFPQVIMLKIS